MTLKMKIVVGLYFFSILTLGFLSQKLVLAETSTTTVNITGPDTTPPTIFSLLKPNLTYNSTDITWTTDEDVASSSLDYGVSTSSLTTIEESYGLRNHKVSLSSLLEDTLYYIQIRSEDSSHNTSTYNYDLNGSDYTFTTLVNSPPVISDVVTSSRTQTTINIDWTTNELATSYIDYGTSTGSLGETSGTSTLATTHEINLISLATSTPYYFQVRSADAEGNLTTNTNGGSYYSFTTKGPDVIVSGVSASLIGTTTATINWTTNELTSSIVDYGLTTVNLNLMASSTSSLTTHSLSLTGLSANTIYYYQIGGEDTIGDSFTDDNSGNYYHFTTQAVTTPSSGSVVLPPSPTPTNNLDLGQLEVLINNGSQYTNHRSIKVSFNNFSQLSQFKISETNDFKNANWQNIEEFFNWELSDSDGKKYLYFKFRNSDNEESVSIQKSIILDRNAPAPPVNFNGSLIKNGIELSWLLPSEGDTAGVRIFRSGNGYILNPLFDGEVSFEGKKEKAFDFDIIEGKVYYYTAFSYDYARNYSNAALFEIKYISSKKEENVTTKTEQTNNNYQSNTNITEFNIKKSNETTEQKNNKNDNNENQNNYTNKETEDIKKVFIRKIEDVSIDLKKKELPVLMSDSKEELSQNKPQIPRKILHYLARTPVTIILENYYVSKEIKMITLKIGDKAKYIIQTDKNGVPKVRVETPPNQGSYDINIEIIYKNKTKDVVEVAELKVDPFGYVYQELVAPILKLFSKGKIILWEFNKKSIRINNAKVTLYKLDEKNKKWSLFIASDYNQENPQFTDQEGSFGYMVPRGRYYILAEKDGYGKVKTGEMKVKNTIINRNIKLSSAIVPWWKVKDNLQAISLIIVVISFLVISGFVVVKKIF